MTYETIDVRPTAGALGAEVFDVDLAEDLDNRTFSEIYDAFGRYAVLFFRDQTLTPDQHLAFARRFGGIDVNRYFPTVEGYPEIAEVRKEPHEKQNIGEYWHTDHSYDEAPALGSMLLAREVPDHGGDTMFSSMYAAYEALSDGMRSMLDKMTAVHSGTYAFGTKAPHRGELEEKLQRSETADAEVEHPVVITHPISGRRALYVNRSFTQRFKDMTVQESKPLLDFLYAHAARPEFTTRLRWRNGTLAFWDNRATHHLAVNDYHGQRRLMHRITIEGETLN